MILEARKSGALRDGQTVVELTSGNTGTGLALACRALGHPFVAVISRGNSMERARQMKALGAEVVLVDQAPGAVEGQVSGEDLALVDRRARQIVEERGAFRANQFELPSNPLAHERYTGEEVWAQASGGGARVDVFADFAGTSGSFVGVMRALRKHNPDVRGYLLEPAGARVLAGHAVSNPSHAIQGGGYSIADPPLLDRSLVTDYLPVTDADATAGARDLAAEEGIFGGFSGGANFAAACDLLRTRERGATVVILIPDSGLKYLSTGLF
jgi:cysteine synthase A